MVSTGLANTAAEDSLTTAAEEGAAAVPEATPAEEAMARAVTVPEEVDTATRRCCPESVAANAILRIKTLSFFFISLCEIHFDKNVTIQCFQLRKHYSTF